MTDLEGSQVSDGEGSSVSKHTTWVEIPIEEENDDNAPVPRNSPITTAATSTSRDDDAESNVEKSQNAVSGKPNDTTSTADNSVQVNQSNEKEDDAADLEPIHQTSPEPGGPFSYLRRLISRVKRIRKRKIHPEKCEIYVIHGDDSLHSDEANGSSPGNNANCSNPSVTDGISLGESGLHRKIPDPFLVSPLDLSSNVEEGSRSALYYLFVYLFWLGMYPKRLNGKNRIVYWMPFIIISFASTFSGACSVKDQYFSTEDPLLRFIGLGFYINAFFLRVYISYLMAFKLKKIMEFFRILGKFGQCLPKPRVLLHVAFPLVSSVLLGTLLTFALTVSLFDDEEYNIVDLIQWRAFRFSETLFIWNKTAAENQTALLAEEFEGDATAKSIFLGTTSFFVKITGSTVTIVMRDICIVLAVTISSLTTIFIALLNYEEKQSEEEHSRIWEFYKNLRALSKLTEDEFGLLLQFAHVHNMFYCSYLSFHGFKEGDKWYVLILYASIFVKIAHFYLRSAKASSMNSRFRTWIHKFCAGGKTPFLENGEYVATSVLLDQLRTEPIGVGSSLFYIDYSFLWRFTTFVSSYFFFFAEHSTD